MRKSASRVGSELPAVLAAEEQMKVIGREMKKSLQPALEAGGRGFSYLLDNAKEAIFSASLGMCKGFFEEGHGSF